jgi:hypothetical protein
MAASSTHCYWTYRSQNNERFNTRCLAYACTSGILVTTGDNLGYSGPKHLKGCKVVAFCDRAGNIIAPFVTAPGNRNESPLLRDALPRLTEMARAIGAGRQGSTLSLDGVYDCRDNRRAIFNRGMTPNIPENPRGRKTPKRGHKQRLDPAIFEERFRTIERVFSWEDKFAVCCCASNASVTCTTL